MRHEIIVLSLILFLSCSNIESDFELAKRENSIDAYSNFLQKYPEVWK